MYNSVRTSSNRIIPVGHRKPDWTKQSNRLFDAKGNPKKPRRKCLRNQLLLNGFDVQEGITVKKVEKIRVPIQLKNGQMGEREMYIGEVDGRRVNRTGYAHSHTNNGKTPGRWEYA